MMLTFIEVKLDGNLQHHGFQVSMQARLEGGMDSLRSSSCLIGEASGRLAENKELQYVLENWRDAYHHLGDSPHRIVPKEVIYGGSINPIADCQLATQRLRELFLQWLSYSGFLPVDRTIRELLQRQHPIQLMIRCSDRHIQLLPWHYWDIVDRYPNLEVGFSVAPDVPIVQNSSTQHRSVKTDELRQMRILAILGHSDGIDVECDRQVIEALPNAHVVFLVEPTRQQVHDSLWEQSWDILFFAGHSQSVKTQGRIFINPSDSLTMEDLRYGIRRAIANGLQLAIFNSCDGLGIAQELEMLQLSTMIVMRQPVPDKVAQQFLRYFLDTFCQGELLYQSVRTARERLQSIEHEYPCATWLPAVVQKPNVKPLAWSKPDVAVDLQAELKASDPPASPKSNVFIRRSLPAMLAVSFIVTSLVMGCRLLGLLQPFEFWLYDRMLSWRLTEPSDERLIIVTIDADDVTYQDTQGMTGRGSLSNEALEQILLKLQPHQPSVIGLDIYRNLRPSGNQNRLSLLLQDTENLIALCAIESDGVEAIAPPVEVPIDRVGFSNVPTDPDRIIRRQFFGMTRDIEGCETDKSLSFQVATHYLKRYEIEPTRLPNGDLLMSAVLSPELNGGVQFNLFLQRSLGNKLSNSRQVSISISILTQLAFILPQSASHLGFYHTVDLRGYSVLLNYRNVETPEDIAYKTIPLRELLEGEWDDRLSELIHDRIILIGNITKSYNDFHLTPMGDSAGIYLQAQMVSHLISVVLDGRPLLRSAPQPIDTVWIGGWALIAAIIVTRLQSQSWRIGLVTGQILLLGGTGWLLFVAGIIMPIVPAALAVAGAIRGVTLLNTYPDP
jgi:CHASE2 domain-containing sensor protein